MKLIKENKLLFALSLICVLAVIVMIVSLCIPKKAKQEPFVPPPFDEDAVSGEPEAPSDSGYSIIYQDGMSFKVGICGKINISNDSADVYLTNILENHAWLKARLYDSDGNILGESGLIKPGEYLKSVTLQYIPDEIDGITIKVMSYEPGTYKSLGAVTLTPKVSLIITK